MRALALVPLMLATSSPLLPGWGTTVFDGWPPERFQNMPDKAVHIIFGRVAINAECGQVLWPEVIEACSDTQNKLLVMPDPCRFPADDNYARLMCHEVAHLDGWPGNHPR
jgi:hypothetical protein